MATTKVILTCCCEINIYSDGSTPSAEIGLWCDLHYAASELRAACESAYKHIRTQNGGKDSPLCRELSEAIWHAGGKTDE